jgi:hypothetical protein
MKDIFKVIKKHYKKKFPKFKDSILDETIKEMTDDIMKNNSNLNRKEIENDLRKALYTKGVNNER